MQPSDIIIQVHLCMEALQVNFYYPATFMERLVTFHKREHAHAHRLPTFQKRDNGYNILSACKDIASTLTNN